jgi:hypothetical protein
VRVSALALATPAGFPATDFTGLRAFSTFPVRREPPPANGKDEHAPRDSDGNVSLAWKAPPLELVLHERPADEARVMNTEVQSTSIHRAMTKADLMSDTPLDPAYLRQQIVGVDSTFETPFGERLMLYCDYTASGRCLRFVEAYLQGLQRIYANTHTEDDVTGRSMFLIGDFS